MTFRKSQEKYVFDDQGCSSCDLVLTKTKDRNDNEIDYVYDSTSKALTSITDTHGRTVSISHDAAGYIDKIIEANGPSTRTWTYGYDATHHLTTYTDPAGGVTTYTWANDQVTKVTDPAQAGGARPTTTLTYASGQTTAVKYAIDDSGNVFQFNFSYASTASSRRDGKGDRSTDVTNVTDPQGTTTYCFADRTGDDTGDGDRALRVVDGEGHRRAQTFSADNAGSSTTSATNDNVAGGSTVIAYNTNSALTQVTEPADVAGNTPATTYFDYSTPSSSAGASFLPSSVVNPQGNCTSYGYDTKGNLTDSYAGLAPAAGKHDC